MNHKDTAIFSGICQHGPNALMQAYVSVLLGEEQYSAVTSYDSIEEGIAYLTGFAEGITALANRDMSTERLVDYGRIVFPSEYSDPEDWTTGVAFAVRKAFAERERGK